jgi:hypothetical protein
LTTNGLLNALPTGVRCPEPLTIASRDGRPPVAVIVNTAPVCTPATVAVTASLPAVLPSV